MALRRIGQQAFRFSAKAEGPSSLDNLAALIDWSHAGQVLAGLYPSAMGEKAWPPLALFKALLLATWYDLSDAPPNQIGKRNHGPLVTATTGKHLRTGLILSYWTRLSGGGGVANAASVLLSRLPGFRPKTPLKEKVKAFIAWWRQLFWPRRRRRNHENGRVLARP